MSDRFQLVGKPALDPGTDIITGSTVGPFVDCGAWVPPSPRRRRVYLSVDTVKALAEAAGIVQPVIDDAGIARLRAEGALDFLKENLHGDLVAVLRRLADHLDAADPAGAADSVAVGAGAGEGSGNVG